MIENSYILDFQVLKEQNIFINEFLGLIHLYENLETESNILDSLQQKQFIKLAENEIIIREKGNLLIEFLLIEKVNSVKSKKEIRKSERVVNNELDSFIEDFRNKWKGLKPGSMGSLSTCKEKMKRWMQENPTYSPQQILTAAKIYINSLDNHTYLQQADYFIYKKDGKEESSRLSAFVDEIDTTITDNWTTSLK